MSAIEAEIRRKVIQWLNYADEDIQLARHALTLTTGVPYRLVAYHAQQCAEKSLKAYLVCHRIDFPYTQNIHGYWNYAATRLIGVTHFWTPRS
jgi:HEPN domain-containing protein